MSGIVVDAENQGLLVGHGCPRVCLFSGGRQAKRAADRFAVARSASRTKRDGARPGWPARRGQPLAELVELVATDAHQPGLRLGAEERRGRAPADAAGETTVAW